MQWVTRDTLAAMAAERHLEQYARRMDTPLLNGTTPRQTQSRLRRLGPTPTPEQVDEAMGNKSWTKAMCDECKREDGDTWLAIGRTTMCKTCFTEAQAGFPQETNDAHDSCDGE